MAVNTSKRIPVKFIRDGAKAAYDKKDRCYICDSKEDLELHHTHGLTNLLETWAKKNKIDLSTDEKVLEIRDRFIHEHSRELYDDVFTLCSKHHLKLHSLYGKSPPLSTAPKQVIWIQKQKDKHNGLEKPNDLVQSEPGSGGNSERRGIFGSLISNNNGPVSFRKVRIG